MKRIVTIISLLLLLLVGYGTFVFFKSRCFVANIRFDPANLTRVTIFESPAEKITELDISSGHCRHVIWNPKGVKHLSLSYTMPSGRNVVYREEVVIPKREVTYTITGEDVSCSVQNEGSR